MQQEFHLQGCNLLLNLPADMTIANSAVSPPPLSSCKTTSTPWCSPCASRSPVASFKNWEMSETQVFVFALYARLIFWLFLRHLGSNEMLRIIEFFPWVLSFSLSFWKILLKFWLLFRFCTAILLSFLAFWISFLFSSKKTGKRNIYCQNLR